LALLKLNVDIYTLLIFAASARLLREKRVTRDPAGVYAEEALEPPAESECLQRKSTFKFNRTKKLEGDGALMVQKEKYRVEKMINLIDDDLNTLMQESKEEGFRFVDRLMNDYKNGTNNFMKPGEALYGIFNNENMLVAVGGINIDPFSTEDNIGRLRRFYVNKGNRREGIGSLLLQKIINDARNNFKVLVLKTDTEQADKFYTSFGFSKGNQYPNSTHYLILN
jgi:GNAT superfamily N-acetyltransferase